MDYDRGTQSSDCGPVQNLDRPYRFPVKLTSHVLTKQKTLEVHGPVRSHWKFFNMDSLKSLKQNSLNTAWIMVSGAVVDPFIMALDLSRWR